MKLFKKTALAVAVSAMAVAVPAAAADLEFTGDGETIVLADVIFGNGMPGVGSEETLITAPEVTFDLTRGGLNGGDISVAGSEVATIKYTLGGGAIFGEDLSTTARVDSSNGGAGAFNLTVAAGTVTYEVVQGGAIGDNTITFELTFGAAASELDSATFLGYAVKNLTSVLNPSSDSKRVELGVEYVEAGTTDGDAINPTETDQPLVIFGSQAPIDLIADAVDFNTPDFTRINVGNAERTFTGGTSDGRSDFDPAGDITVVNLGTLQLQRQEIDTDAFPGSGGGLVRKENGDEFDFQGGDDHTLTISVGSGSMQVGSSVYLSESAMCTGTALFANTISAAEATSFTLAVSGSTTDLTTEYNLCYSVLTGSDADTIPEVGDINATWGIDFFNARYDNIDEEAGPFGDLVRNGCIASFFNIPASSNSDTAYVRLTNTSSVNEGDIRGTLYAQDGTVLGADVAIAPDLAVSATQIFSTEGANRTTGAGQEVIDIETAFGVSGSDYKGRARLVLKGAFDTCEGLGLIRSASTGALYNMSATTQGNEAALPNDGNNGN
ncbi:hypothetical protein PN836_012755 [Ningiella sp. W23]|uniref:hypothetical protein n=1 Tax=Ningiella sp. W23 TaxID=3023715 RepID=UPI0037580451